MIKRFFCELSRILSYSFQASFVVSPLIIDSRQVVIDAIAMLRSMMIIIVTSPRDSTVVIHHVHGLEFTPTMDSTTDNVVTLCRSS